MSLLMACHVVPRSLAAFGQTARVPTFGRIAKHGQMAKQMLWPRNSPALWSPALCMSYKSNMINEEDVLPLKLQKSLNKIVRDEKFTSHSIKSRVIPPDGGSFMGILREISIKGKTENGEQEIDLFVKSIIPDAELTIYSIPGIYEKETTIYKCIFKMINELQEEAKIPLEYRYNTLKTYEGIDNEDIIMENLAKKGYTMCERMQVIPLKFAELAIQQLAKFHSMAFVMQAKRPDFFETKVKTLKQPYNYDTPDWEKFVGNVSQIVMTILDPEARKRVAKFLPTTYEKYSRYTQDPNSVRSFVHGDFRANNMMIKLIDDKITQVVPLDFQLTFYGCPIIDFLFFIFTGTDQEFRKHHLEDLKDLYHDSMRQFLTYFDLDVDSYYSRNEFEKIYKERLDYGLMISLWFIPMVLADKGAVPDVTKADLSIMDFKFNETIKNRVRDAVDDFIKWGYI